MNKYQMTARDIMMCHLAYVEAKRDKLGFYYQEALNEIVRDLYETVHGGFYKYHSLSKQAGALWSMIVQMEPFDMYNGETAFMAVDYFLRMNFYNLQLPDPNAFYYEMKDKTPEEVSVALDPYLVREDPSVL